jgi:apolipoprotein N-acyltransferase
MSSAANTLPAWRRSTLAIALVGSLLMWASLPPLALGWLGWIAPIPWLVLVRFDTLPGRRPYRSLYLAGFAFWLATLYWLSLPHPAVIPLWCILAAYLAIYPPIFVGLSRVAVHRFALPLWLAAPIVWTGLELVRAHLLTGFLMGSLGHSQVHWTALIQISDIVGEYGVDFVMILTAACLTSAFCPKGRIKRSDSDNPQPERSSAAAAGNPQLPIAFHPIALVPAVIALAATLAYGYARISKANEVHESLQATGPRIALIQGNSLAEWKADPQREGQIMDSYLALSKQAIEKARSIGNGRPVDLVVWPETMFRTPLITFDAGARLPQEASRTPEMLSSYGPHDLAAVVKRIGAPILVGIDRWQYRAPKSDREESRLTVFNCAVMVGRDGKIVGTYDKAHLVMFGEYIPFASWLPFLYNISPLTGGIEAGAGPSALRLNGMYCVAPNICYETAIPHVLRRQVRVLESRNELPDVLVNVTNDAWYWGSSGLVLHLDCAVFRAVETRLPMVISANGGISAWIDHLGRIRAQSPKMKPDTIVADVEPSGLSSPYIRYGDWFAGLCLGACVLLTIAGWRASRSLHKQIVSTPSTT